MEPGIPNQVSMMQKSKMTGGKIKSSELESCKYHLEANSFYSWFINFLHLGLMRLGVAVIR